MFEKYHDNRLIIKSLIYEVKKSHFPYLKIILYSIICAFGYYIIILFWISFERKIFDDIEEIFNNIYRIIKIITYKSPYKKLNQSPKNKNCTVLYLSRFDLGLRQLILTNAYAEGGSLGGAPIFKTQISGNYKFDKITRNKTIETFYLFNPKEDSKFFKGNYLIVSDKNWFSLFKEICNVSDYIIIDYESEITESVFMEIKHLINLKRKNLIMFYTETQKEKIYANFPQLEGLIFKYIELKPHKTNGEIFCGMARFELNHISEADKIKKIVRDNKNKIENELNFIGETFMKKKSTLANKA